MFASGMGLICTMLTQRCDGRLGGRRGIDAALGERQGAEVERPGVRESLDVGEHPGVERRGVQESLDVDEHPGVECRGVQESLDVGERPGVERPGVRESLDVGNHLGLDVDSPGDEESSDSDASDGASLGDGLDRQKVARTALMRTLAQRCQRCLRRIGGDDVSQSAQNLGFSRRWRFTAGRAARTVALLRRPSSGYPADLPLMDKFQINFIDQLIRIHHIADDGSALQDLFGLMFWGLGVTLKVAL